MIVKRAADLEVDNPKLWHAFSDAKRGFEATIFSLRPRADSKTAIGKLNTYSLFAEHFSRLARQAAQNLRFVQTSLLQVISDTGGVTETPAGRAGMIVPTGIATDSSTSAFFEDLQLNNV